MLHALTGQTALLVNSFHHQNVKVLAPTLAVDAISEDGYIEAAHMPGHKYFLAVQWHPEIFRQSSPAMQRVFRSFVDACRGSHA
jgi:putative glutamine amidotransferase